MVIIEYIELFIVMGCVGQLVVFFVVEYGRDSIDHEEVKGLWVVDINDNGFVNEENCSGYVVHPFV